jgi:hypothetical protein
MRTPRSLVRLGLVLLLGCGAGRSLDTGGAAHQASPAEPGGYAEEESAGDVTTATGGAEYDREMPASVPYDSAAPAPMLA